MNTTTFMQHRSKIHILIVLIMAGISLLSLIKNKLSIKSMKIVRIAVISALVIFYALIAKTNRTGYIQNTMFVILFSMVYFSSAGKKDSIMKAFVNIVVILSVISLLFYIFGSFLNVISPTGTVYYTWGRNENIACNHYFWLYYEAQTLDFLVFKDLVRNSAIFPEATMFGIVLSIAIGYELLMKDKYNKLKIIIMFITAFTTTATLAMVSSIIVIVFRIMANILKSKSLPWKKIGLFIFVIIGLIGAVIVFNYKFSTDEGEGSVAVRLDHLLACAKAWMHHPITGVGFNNLDAVMTYARYNQGMSVGLLYIFACGLYWAAYMFCLYCQIY